MANYVSKDGLLYFWTLLKTKLAGKSDVGHNHVASDVTDFATEVAKVKVSNATTADSANAVAWGNVSGKPSSYTPSSHNQASSTINALTGYSKPSSTSALATTDTLNAALGKLEKALDGKQASGTYVTASSATATETSLTTTSDAKVPTSKAVATYVTSLGYKTTDTVTTATTSGSGNAVTGITATNGALTVTKGKSFLETSGGTMTGAINYVHATEAANRKYYITSSLQDGFTIGFEEDSLLKNYIRVTGGGAVMLKESPASTSNSTNIATTAWVKSLGYKTTDNDTKNTAGSTASTSKLFIVGATEQSANPQTYSNTKCYVGTDNCLYSNGTKVLTAHQSLANYYNKTEIDSKLTSAMRYKGSVAAYANLPTTNLAVGDMYNVTATGANYVWDGSAWDETGMIVDLTPYAKTADLVAVTNTEIDTIVAS